METYLSTTVVWACVLIISITDGYTIMVVLAILALLALAIGMDKLLVGFWEQMRFEYLVYKSAKEPEAEIHEGLEPYEGLSPVELMAMSVMLVTILALLRFFEIPDLTKLVVLGFGVIVTVSMTVVALTFYTWLRIWRRRQEDRVVTIRAKMRPMFSKPDAPFEYIVKTGRLHELSFKTKDDLPDWLR